MLHIKNTFKMRSIFLVNMNNWFLEGIVKILWEKSKDSRNTDIVLMNIKTLQYHSLNEQWYFFLFSRMETWVGDVLSLLKLLGLYFN